LFPVPFGSFLSVSEPLQRVRLAADLASAASSSADQTLSASLECPGYL
jgi:hypothetical protein